METNVNANRTIVNRCVIPIEFCHGKSVFFNAFVIGMTTKQLEHKVLPEEGRGSGDQVPPKENPS